MAQCKGSILILTLFYLTVSALLIASVAHFLSRAQKVNGSMLQQLDTHLLLTNTSIAEPSLLIQHLTEEFNWSELTPVRLNAIPTIDRLDFSNLFSCFSPALNDWYQLQQTLTMASFYRVFKKTKTEFPPPYLVVITVSCFDIGKSEQKYKSINLLHYLSSESLSLKFSLPMIENKEA